MISYGELIGLSCAGVWAINSLIIRTQSFAVPPALMNAVRCGIATLMFWALLPFEHPIQAYPQVPINEWLLLIGSVTIGVIIGDTLYLKAIKEIGVSRTMALVGTVPITTLFFEQLLLDIPVSTTFVIGCFLAAAGVTCLSYQTKDEKTIADSAAIRLKFGAALSLTASCLWGLSTTMMKPALAHLTAVQANSVRMPIVASVLLIAWRANPKRGRLKQISRRALLIVGFTGIMGMGIGSMLYLMSISMVGPSKTAILTSAAPVISLILAVVILKEKLTLRLLIGVALCVSGVYLVL